MSRRLTRRIKKALYDRQLGYVKVAVHAYITLLDKSTDEDSTYTFNYFSKELINQPDTVVCYTLHGRIDFALTPHSHASSTASTSAYASCAAQCTNLSCCVTQDSKCGRSMHAQLTASTVWHSPC